MAKARMTTKWDLSVLYKNDRDPAITRDLVEYVRASDNFAKRWSKRDDYLNSPPVLKKVLDEYEKYISRFTYGGAAGYYFILRELQNQSDTYVKSQTNKINELIAKQVNKVQFFELRLAKVSPAQQKQFLNYQGLSAYRHWLESLFTQAKHQLSDEQEQIMNLKWNTSNNLWVAMVAEMVSSEQRKVLQEDGKKELTTLEGTLSLINSQKKRVRDDAAAAFNDMLANNVDVAIHEINAILGDKKVNDELRNFKRPDASRHLNDDIDTKIVDTLVKTVTTHNTIAHRFYKLKATLMGKPTMAYHERNVEYGKLDQLYTYENAVSLLGGALRKLDPQLDDIFGQLLAGGNIDVYPAKGKRGGAACMHATPAYPTYILLNHTNRLRDVTTLAHEVGHGVHNELMREKQHSLYFGSSLATAEVASQYLEDFVLDEVAQEVNDETALALSMSRLNDDVSSVFRQIACYKFELDLHRAYRQSGYLSREEIGKIFRKNMSAYMGPAVEQSPGSENWWVYWSHIRAFFYVYSYSSGLLIAKYLQGQTRNDPTFVGRVKEFLGAGSSESPQNIFKELGIDIGSADFWRAGLKEIADQLKVAENLAKKIGKI